MVSKTKDTASNHKSVRCTPSVGDLGCLRVLEYGRDQALRCYHHLRHCGQRRRMRQRRETTTHGGVHSPTTTTAQPDKSNVTVGYTTECGRHAKSSVLCVCVCVCTMSFTQRDLRAPAQICGQSTTGTEVGWGCWSH